ncbi:hypothetical protein [Desulfovibrio inopinatus]|uniref:hypothetical protein n=1 Tax=Desulfovibrio inopinatus TaxID=102109 RepID=UPI0012EC7EF8|nr:hypothetical protein [Desulfovibrio inopinatus]
MPIWSKRLFNEAESIPDDEGRIAVLVGDFRFGNGICLCAEQDDGVLADGFVAIERKAMTPDYDQYMLKRGLLGLEYWHRHFGGRATYLFWCLFGREVQDRLAGKHLKQGKYHHPTFNYSEIAKALPELDIVDVSPLLSQRMHDVIRLFIDSSSHPSQIGYIFLNGVLCKGYSPMEAYRSAVREVERDLCNLAKQMVESAGCKIVLTGRSVWLDTLVRYLGATGFKKLADAGLVLAPLDRAPGHKTASDICAEFDVSACAVVVVSAGGKDLSSALAKAFNTDEDVWADVPCIDWESAAALIIESRRGTPNFPRLSPSLPESKNVIRLKVFERFVELGTAGMPNWGGLRYLLEQMASQQVPRTPFPKQLDYSISGDALVTGEGIAFLIGGGHAVQQYASGERVPTRQSLNNFAQNIAERVTLSKSLNIDYLHVIFPDKQSILTEAYPFKVVQCLGEEYLKEVDPAFGPHILYPVEELKRSSQSPFYPLDTHLTDAGSLTVLRLMVEKLGFDVPQAYERIAKCIVKPVRRPGDLGRKLVPMRYQEVLQLEPDWRNRYFISGGGFNEGMIDIILSPDAPIHKTVLLFGDSFFRLMLRHMGAVFTRIICLRTRFLHPEMVSLIRPDIIFTGNAERYLSNVIPDRDAWAFALYPHLRGTTELAMKPEFLEAWSAVTSPRSKKSQAFFERIEKI